MNKSNKCKVFTESIYQFKIGESQSIEVYHDITKQTFVGLQDVLKISSTFHRNNFSSSKTSLRRKDILEEEKLLRWRSVEDVFETCLLDVLGYY